MSTQLDIFNHFRVTGRSDDEILRTRTFESIKALLESAITDDQWLALSGRIGSGKTHTIITALREIFDARGGLEVVELKSPERTKITANQVLAAFIRDLGKKFLGSDYTKKGGDARQAQVDRILMSAKAQGITIILLIDEAQELQSTVLNTIKRMRDVTFIKRAIHLPVFLIGQPSLASLVGNNIEVQDRIKSYAFGYTRKELIEIAKFRGLGLLDGDICAKLVDALTDHETILTEQLPTPLRLKKKIEQAMERAYNVGADKVTLAHFDVPMLEQPKKTAEPKKKVEISGEKVAATVNDIGKKEAS